MWGYISLKPNLKKAYNFNPFTKITESYDVYIKNNIKYLVKGDNIYILDHEVDINTIDKHHMYGIYKIGDKYYDGFYTTKKYFEEDRVDLFNWFDAL